MTRLGGILLLALLRWNRRPTSPRRRTSGWEERSRQRNDLLEWQTVCLVSAGWL